MTRLALPSRLKLRPNLALSALLGGAGKLPSVPGFYNFTGSNLPNWKAAFAAQQAGTSNAALAALGDSTFAGAGSTGNGVLSNAKSLSWPTQLAGLVPGGTWSSQWGDNNVSAPGGGSALVQYDTRLTDSGWTIDTNGTIAGFVIREVAPAVGALSFTPPNQIDTIEVRYVTTSGGTGFFTIGVDGGAALATVNTGLAAGIGKTTITTTLGNHTINLNRTTATNNDVLEISIAAYNSASKEVSIYNWGAYGWSSANFIVATNPWSPLNVMKAVAPKLTIFEAGIINDWNGATARATVTNNQTTVINALLGAGGDVILMSGAPSNPATKASLATQANYVADMKALAYSLGIPFINVWELFGSGFHTAWMSDDLHPNSTGYGQIASYANTALPSTFRAA